MKEEERRTARLQVTSRKTTWRGTDSQEDRAAKTKRNAPTSALQRPKEPPMQPQATRTEVSSYRGDVFFPNVVFAYDTMPHHNLHINTDRSTLIVSKKRKI